MKIDVIKNILEDAKVCGHLATITLVNGQVSHVNFSKHIKTFTATDDIILDEERHLVTIIDTDGSRDYIDSDSIIRIFSKEGL
jgi:hypothetical protein|nr:MAG TPA: hypothetical protein [Caudoviricetes sp.]